VTTIQTELIGQFAQSPHDTYQTYCGLDTCLTHEILSTIKETFSRRLADPIGPGLIYQFERALQGPYLEIMQRGFRVDDLGRRAAAEQLRQKRDALQLLLNRFAEATWGKGLNPRSPPQLKEFFFEAMRLPEVWLSKKGVKKLSTDREALEKLEHYLHARPFVQIILAIRDTAKQLEVFETGIDPDFRFRAGYNIAGTETGRPSSSENAFGTAGNALNIPSGLRYVFEADPGMKMCVIDLEQVEARDVGFFIGCLFGDWKFLDNCESGDLHTNNAKLVWPELPWTGHPREDRAIADQIYYRDMSYRDLAKRGSHLSNYSGTAWTAARSLKTPLPVLEEFQARYCRGRYGHKTLPDIDPAFPGIPRYWQWVAQQLQTTQKLITPFGRERHFFGRPNDDATLREAIAYLPQSTTADRMNLGLWRVWHKMPQVELLAQTYDSITFQYDAQREAQVIPQALELIRVELRSPCARSYVVPGEAKVGWNWGPQSASNPHGLAKWKESSPDGRSAPARGISRVIA
jgi:DNA polymerase I-like protein with 3'-5' exonuclease and polymerase domains